MCRQEQSDRLLVMYPSTLIILTEESDGLFYKVSPPSAAPHQRHCPRLAVNQSLCLQGKLPLNMITVTTPCQDVRPNTFMIEGTLAHPAALPGGHCEACLPLR